MGGQCRNPHLIVVVSEVKNDGIWFTVTLGNGLKVVNTSNRYILFLGKKSLKMWSCCGIDSKGSSVEHSESHW